MLYGVHGVDEAALQVAEGCVATCELFFELGNLLCSSLQLSVEEEGALCVRQLSVSNGAILCDSVSGIDHRQSLT